MATRSQLQQIDALALTATLKEFLTETEQTVLAAAYELQDGNDPVEHVAIARAIGKSSATVLRARRNIEAVASWLVRHGVGAR